jgi:hypothetical protein
MEDYLFNFVNADFIASLDFVADSFLLYFPNYDFLSWEKGILHLESVSNGVQEIYLKSGNCSFVISISKQASLLSVFSKFWG